jgi:hypothetical protein
MSVFFPRIQVHTIFDLYFRVLFTSYKTETCKIYYLLCNLIFRTSFAFCSSSKNKNSALIHITGKHIGRINSENIWRKSIYAFERFIVVLFISCDFAMHLRRNWGGRITALSSDISSLIWRLSIYILSNSFVITWDIRLIVIILPLNCVVGFDAGWKHARWGGVQIQQPN